MNDEGALAPRGAISLNPFNRRGFGDDLFIALVQGIAKASGKELQGLFGDTTPNCCQENPSDDCVYNAGKAKNGGGFEACYVKGDAKIEDFDVEAMKCNIDLHYRQSDKCISMAGSRCEYGGGIMKGEMGWWTSGHDSANQLSAEDSGTLQAAAESMRGASISYDEVSNGAIELAVVGQNGLTVSMTFTGHQGKEC